MRSVVAVGSSLGVGLRGVPRRRGDGRLEGRFCLGLGPRLAALDGELAGHLAAAHARWQAAVERLTSLEHDVLPASDQAAKLSMQAYREGARDLASALVAERDLAAVRAEINDARAAAAIAFAELRLAAGEDVHGQ